eukprot:scaffold12149_cov214-Amphora_coffeaeformis.AAC.7
MGTSMGKVSYTPSVGIAQEKVLCTIRHECLGILVQLRVECWIGGKNRITLYHRWVECRGEFKRFFFVSFGTVFRRGAGTPSDENQELAPRIGLRCRRSGAIMCDSHLRVNSSR